jgi:hypothetical protein
VKHASGSLKLVGFCEIAIVRALCNIVAQLPHLRRICVAPILTALIMVNYCCGGFGSYPAILRPEQFRHSRRAFAYLLALPAIR